MAREELLNKLLAGAEAHGAQSEPDHEVGDLQDILRTCWKHLSEDQARAVFEEHKDIVDEWL